MDNRIDTRANEFAAIYKIAEKIHASRSIDEVIRISTKELKSILKLDIVYLFLRDGQEYTLAGYLPHSKKFYEVGKDWIEQSLCGIGDATNSTVCFDDILSEKQCLIDFSKKARIRSIISLPIQAPDGNLGFISMASRSVREFSKEQFFLEAMVSQVTIALSNGKLYQRTRQKLVEGNRARGRLSKYQYQLEDMVRERTKELQNQYQEIEKEVAERKKAELAEREQRTLAQALEETAAILNSTLDLEEVLDAILVTLENVIPHDSANIMLIASDENVAFVARYKGNPKVKNSDTSPTSHFIISETPTLRTMHETKRPFVIQDVKDDSSWIDQIGSDWIRSYMAAPITFGENVLGFLNIVSNTPKFYTQSIAERLQAFANHASIAIRNARLFEQAHDLAVLEERQRIARNMHDAVSQTLFTANVVAEALPAQWDRDPHKGMEGLETIRRLVRGALAEMRTVLVELRPDAITKSDLGELITQLAYGARSYSEIGITLNIQGEHRLPPNIQFVIFRIAQEIFNNIIKHSRASHVTVNFLNEGHKLYLAIFDNGCGFVLNEVESKRLGIPIIKERADSIGASLNISSSLGEGTSIQLLWDDSSENSNE